MALRLAAPVSATFALALWPAGAGGLASLLVLAAIVAASARLLVVVGEAAESRGGRRTVVLACGGVVCLVAAGALQAPLLVAGCVACSALERLGSPVARGGSVSEPVELAEAPVSRAA